MLIDALLFELFDDFYFCSNTCMVRSRLPECIVPLHPFEPYENILHCIIKGMSHMELSRDVWWWNHDCKRFFAVIYFGMEIFLIQPFLVNTIFHLLRIVCLC